MHVHEPFAPSASAAALRHSRALNVGSFHSPTERVLSTQVARRFIELFFGRLDARTATFDVTRDLVSHFFPGDYETVPPGVDLEAYRAVDQDGVVEIAFALEEERAALRLFLRALRRLPADVSWRATIWTPRADDLPPRLGRFLRERVSFVSASESSLPDVLGRADVLCRRLQWCRPCTSGPAQGDRRRYGPDCDTHTGLRGGSCATASRACSSSDPTWPCSRPSYCDW